MSVFTMPDIEKLLKRYRMLEENVNERLHGLLDPDGGSMMHILHRVKTPESIREKMLRKQGKYQSVSDLTDILGFRVICYFSGDVDTVAEKISGCFRVNWARSKDKRKLIDARAFGYLSLHYICALPEEDGEFGDLWFEIQIMTILQHTWAMIEHDLGYKSEIEIPRDIRRSFSKAASLLETTDDIFSDISLKLEQYRKKVSLDMESGSLDDLFFDRLTITEYTARNRDYRGLLQEIASITDAHITEGRPESQLPLIAFLGISTLGEMSEQIRKYHDLAIKLAGKYLQDSELDELSSTVAYYYLFRAKLIKDGYGREKIREFLELTSYNQTLIDNHTERILKDREELLHDT